MEREGWADAFAVVLRRALRHNAPHLREREPLVDLSGLLAWGADHPSMTPGLLLQIALRRATLAQD
jgi:hypothetical protein